MKNERQGHCEEGRHFPSVSRFLKKHKETGSYKNKPRLGRPCATTPAQDEKLMQLSLNNREKLAMEPNKQWRNFLKEYDYGDSIDLKEIENKTKVVLKHNGVFIDIMDMISHKITAVSTPGTLQVISYGSGREENHVVCPRRVTQRNLVLMFTPVNIIESIATVILILFTKLKEPVKKISKRFSKQKTQSKNSTVGSSCQLQLPGKKEGKSTGLHCCRKMKAIVCNCLTFVLQLCIFEMISAMSFFLDNNSSWGLISLLVLVFEYVAKGVTLSIFIHKYNVPYSRRNMVLAILNQAIPLLKKYSKSGNVISQHDGKDVDLEQRSKNYLKVATLVKVLREFVLVFLSVYILAQYSSRSQTIAFEGFSLLLY